MAWCTPWPSTEAPTAAHYRILKGAVLYLKTTRKLRLTFSKALDFNDLGTSFIPLLIAIPVLLGSSAALLKKQAG